MGFLCSFEKKTKVNTATTNDSFIPVPSHFNQSEIVALDCVNINYRKFEDLSKQDVIYATKIKKSLKCHNQVDSININANGKMEYREQVVAFSKNGFFHISHWTSLAHL